MRTLMIHGNRRKGAPKKKPCKRQHKHGKKGTDSRGCGDGKGTEKSPQGIAAVHGIHAFGGVGSIVFDENGTDI